MCRIIQTEWRCGEMAKDTATVAMECEQETVPKLSIGTIFNDAEVTSIQDHDTVARPLSVTVELLVSEVLIHTDHLALCLGLPCPVKGPSLDWWNLGASPRAEDTCEMYSRFCG